MLWNRTTNKKYIGQTTLEPNVRFRSHRAAARSLKTRDRMAISRAIHKYGWQAFDKFVLERCSSLEDLNAAETYWISRYATLAPLGYNLTTGGGNFGSPSPETIEKRRKALTGKRRSEEVRRLLSAAKMGNDIGPEGRAKISKARRDRPIPGFIGCQKGRVRSDELKDRISKAMTGIKRSEEFKDKISKTMAGDGCHAAVLTWEMVRAIRKKALTGAKQKDLAAEFSITQPNVSRILSNRIWKVERDPLVAI